MPDDMGLMGVMDGMSSGIGGFPGYLGGSPWGFGGMGGMPGSAGGSRLGVPQSPFGDNVYRPSLDHLTSGAEDPTPPSTQYTDSDTFSLEELCLSPVREQTPQLRERDLREGGGGGILRGEGEFGVEGEEEGQGQGGFQRVVAGGGGGRA